MTFCDLKPGTQLWPGTTVWAVIPAQEVSGNNLIFRFRDPVAGTKQEGNVVPIGQHCQARLGIGLERAAFRQQILSATACVLEHPRKLGGSYLAVVLKDDELAKVQPALLNVTH